MPNLVMRLPSGMLTIAAAICFLGSPIADGGTIAVQWSGGDGDINREMTFRTSAMVDWVSFWRGMFKDSATPLIDFSKFEVVGLILPKDRSLVRFAFDPAFADDGNDLIMTYRMEIAGLSNSPMTGSRYAIAVIPRTPKTVVFRPEASTDPERALLKEQRWLTVEAGPLNASGPDKLPAMPLVQGGHASFGTVGFHGAPTELIEVFRGGAALQKAGGKEICIAHIAITPDSALKAEFTSSDGEMPTDQFVSIQHYHFNAKGGEIMVTVRVDGRQQTVEAGGETFDLRDGNFIRVAIRSDRRIEATQIKVVRAESPLDGSDEQEVKNLFREHPMKAQDK